MNNAHKIGIYVLIFSLFVLVSVYADTSVHPLTRGLADTLYCKLTGCTMEGDIDMQGNSIINATLQGGVLANFTIQDYWVNLSINDSDAYFRWNATNQTLELWVNGEIQQNWGASTTIFQEATFLDNAFFQNIFLQAAAGDAVLLNTTLIVLGNTTSTFYFGSGRYLTDVCLTNGTGCNITQDINISGIVANVVGVSPWIINTTVGSQQQISFNESHFNQTVQDLAEVRAYEETFIVEVSSGFGTAQSSELLGFEITCITVTPPSGATYRFEAVEDGNGTIIDKDRIPHTNIWGITKSHSLNDYVNTTISAATIDGNYSVKIKYLDNFR